MWGIKDTKLVNALTRFNIQTLHLADRGEYKEKGQRARAEGNAKWNLLWHRPRMRLLIVSGYNFHTAPAAAADAVYSSCIAILMVYHPFSNPFSYTLNRLALILIFMLLLVSARLYCWILTRSLSLSLSCLIWFHCALAGISFNSAFFSCFVLVLLLLHFCIILVIFINIYETSRAAWNKSWISEMEYPCIRFRT